MTMMKLSAPAKECRKNFRTSNFSSSPIPEPLLPVAENSEK